jgi:hypothetical protein
LAQRGRVRIFGEVHADARGGQDRRLAFIEAGSQERVSPGLSLLEIDRYEAQPVRDAEPDANEALTLPSLRAWPVDLEDS